MYGEKTSATGNRDIKSNSYRSAEQETFPWCLDIRSIMNIAIPRKAPAANFPPNLSTIFYHERVHRSRISIFFILNPDQDINHQEAPKDAPIPS